MAKKGQTMIYKKQDRKQKIKQHDPNIKPGWNHVVLQKSKLVLLH